MRPVRLAALAAIALFVAGCGSILAGLPRSGSRPVHRKGAIP
jgi:hypothetical protein